MHPNLLFFQEHFHGIRPVDEIPLNGTTLSSRTIEIIWTHDMENAFPIIEEETIDDNFNDVTNSETLSEHDTESIDNPRSNELFSEESDDDSPDLVLESSSENKQNSLTNGNNEQQEVLDFSNVKISDGVNLCSRKIHA